MLTRADKWLIGILVVIAAVGIAVSLSFMTTSGSKIAEVRVDGQLVKKMPLKQGYHEQFTVDGELGHNVIETDNGRVRMLESTCPDQICVQTGWIEHAPQQIVCLPFRVVVKVVANHNDVDDIAR